MKFRPWLLALAFTLFSFPSARAATVLVGDPSPDGDGAPTLACGDAANPCDSIQNGVDVANPADTLQIAAGTYVENVVIAKPLALQGAGQGATILVPAQSAPNPCGDSSLCGGAASTVILVRSDSVKILDLAIDGNNPALTSGVSVGGIDVEARNGISTDNVAGSFNGLEVGRVAVRNIFLRGIQSSGGSDVHFHDNLVENVRGDASSIAIFNRVGAGLIENNQVRDCNDGIASNWSNGNVFRNNRVERCSSGLHTDNAGGNGGNPPADRIEGNSVDCQDPSADGYGIFVFVPYQAVEVRDNVVTACAVGAAVFGQAEGLATAVYPEFAANRLENNRIGAVVTTNSNWGGNAYSTSAKAIFSANNLLNNSEQAFYFESQNGFALDVKGHFNRIYGSGGAGAALNGNETGTYAVDLENNWWGCNAGPGDAAASCDQAPASVDFDPWLTLSFGADPTQLPLGGSSTLLAHLQRNSAGQDLGSSASLLDGPALLFATDLGSLSASNVALAGSQAADSFSADGGAGTAHVSVTFDGQTLSQAIEVTEPIDQTPVVPNNPSTGAAPTGLVEGGGCSLQRSAGSSPIWAIGLAAFALAGLGRRRRA